MFKKFVLLIICSIQIRINSQQIGIAISYPSFTTYTEIYHKPYRNNSAKYAQKQICYNYNKNRAQLIPYKMGRRAFKPDINQYWDLCDQQKKPMTKSIKLSNQKILNPTINGQKQSNYKSSSYLTYKNWKQQKKVTLPKKQASDDYCSWVFAYVSLVQSLLLIDSNQIYDLSEQQLLCCSANSNRTIGGCIDDSYKRSQQYGFAYQNQYPYKYQKPQICQKYQKLQKPFILNFRQELSDQQMIQILYYYPFIAIINTDNWIIYGKGVMSCENSTKQRLTHAVLIVGVTDQYWIAKNNWGQGWGIQGYIHINRQKEYNCGVGKQIYYATNLSTIFETNFVFIGLQISLMIFMIIGY